MISNEVLGSLEAVILGNMNAVKGSKGGLASNQYHHLCYLYGAIRNELSVRGYSPTKDEPVNEPVKLDAASNEPKTTPKSTKKARKPKKLKNV